MDLYKSRFFVQSDDRTDKMFFSLPHDWWSRFYEYQWTSQFADSNEIVLDAACGICHPFKFYLVDHCKEVYACDVDPRILDHEAILQEIHAFFGAETAANMDQSYLKKVNVSHANLTDLPYEDEKFDKVFCISVIEHLGEQALLESFQEFNRVLKDDGLFVLTFDYPDISFPLLEKAMSQANFKFYGDVSFELPSDALYSTFHPPTLYCYRAVLKKKK
jgi:SAM-dependent methyltransferase